jgi:hypothetical protein
MTPLDKTLKRVLKIKGLDYVVTLTPEELKITRKGKRTGLDLAWADLVSGESALAIALRASVGKFGADEVKPAPGDSKSRPVRAKRTVPRGKRLPKRAR